MHPRTQRIPSKPGRSHFDLGSCISSGCAVCPSLCSVGPSWDFQHHGCWFLNRLLGKNTPKYCSSTLSGTGVQEPCLRPAHPTWTAWRRDSQMQPESPLGLAPLPCWPRKHGNAPNQSRTRLQSSPWQDSMSSAKMLTTYQLPWPWHGREEACKTNNKILLLLYSSHDP